MAFFRIVRNRREGGCGGWGEGGKPPRCVGSGGAFIKIITVL